MRKFLTSAMAAVVAAGAMLATAGTANAQPRHYYRHHHHGGGNDEVAAAIIGGVAGLALGAALSDGGRRDRGYRSSYYGGYAYDPRYDRYSGGYDRYDDRYYDRGYRYRERTCVTRDRVYDPYIGRRVTIERQYPC